MSLNTTPTSRRDREQPVSGQPRTEPPRAVRQLKRRRRPLLFALMAALVAGGALLAAYAYSSVNDTQEVLVVARDVPRGGVIGAEDLRAVRVGIDPALTPVSSAETSAIVGRRAAVDLWAGTLLTEAAVVETLVPGQGEALVGVSLSPAQMPAQELYAGDSVRIVSTPAEQAEVGNAPPVVIDASVVGVSRIDETGETVVDVVVPRDRAADLAARAATGRVALVLESRER